VVWDRRDGLTLPVEFADFDPMDVHRRRLEVLHHNGRFAGVRYDRQDRDPRYVLHHVHLPRRDRLRGWPRNENARLDWWRAVKSWENGDRAEQKASGISMLIEAATGQTFRDAAGRPVVTEQAAQNVFNFLSTGGAALVKLTPFAKEDVARNPALADIPTMRVKQFDWGSTAPAILAQIARADALDKRIMRAWGRPEREAMEGQHGTKAEAGVQGQIGVIDSESIHGERMRQFNCQTLDTALVTNKGPEWRGRLYYDPAPLQDADKAFRQDVAKALASAPGDPLGGSIDRKKLADDTGLPVDPNYRPVPPLPDGTPGMPGQPGDLSGMSDEELLAHADSLLGNTPKANGRAKPAANGKGRMARMGL
jgi:hypothetical protein